MFDVVLAPGHIVFASDHASDPVRLQWPFERETPTPEAAAPVFVNVQTPGPAHVIFPASDQTHDACIVQKP